MKSLLLLVAPLLVLNCATTNPFNVPDHIKPSSLEVDAEASYFNPLFLLPQFKAGDVIESLKGKCGGKEVTGISVEISKRYIFGELVTYKANGFCAE